VIYLAAEHFVRAPQWTWYILFYFFFAGLSGGTYALATLLRTVGEPRDEAAARLGFYASFVALLFCPVLLTADLAVSWWKFWHMLIDVTPGDQGLNFKYGSPMSVGVWALVVFSVFAAVSALESFALDRRDRTVVGDSGRPMGGVLGRAFNIVGAILALLFASYTGVLLSVSNQPIWSDTWMLGGLFLASGLSGSAALIALMTRYRPKAAFSLAASTRRTGISRSSSSSSWSPSSSRSSRRERPD
jgi:formate-dependent nitrite reductase membrane component NrfD